MAKNHRAPEADVPTYNLVRLAGLVGGPLLGLLVWGGVDFGDPVMARMAGVAVLMAVWWITEALPLGATALVPLVLFPTLGIMDGKAVSKEYGNWVVYLFIGGFMIALAMEKWNLHRRIALNILVRVGGRPVAVMFGFMAGTAFLSMWISNTATTMMMIPIAMAILTKWDELADSVTADSPFATSLMLGIPYAASIGGVMTLVGTPPNTALAGIYSSSFPEQPPLEFARWMLFAVPLGITMLLICWGVLCFPLFKKGTQNHSVDQAKIRQELTGLGRMGWEEKWVLGLFTSVALLWIFRRPFDLGVFQIPGWGNIFPEPGFINDGTVAIAIALILFIIPARKKSQRLLTVDVFPKIPWGIVLLFGGGFALAAGFKNTGLSLWVGEQFVGLANLPLPVFVGLVCLVITFLTEVTSNTASAQILLPVLAGVAIQLDIDPLLLMIPGAISCSFAFMLPVATPPNAIAFATGRISMKHMLRYGLILNLVGVGVVVVFSLFL